jgi:hypothetical protein
MMNEENTSSRRNPATVEYREFDLLKEEFIKLRAQVEEDKKGFLGWVRKWGVLLAFSGSLLALPMGLMELYQRVKDSLRGVDVSRVKAPLEVTHRLNEKNEIFMIEYVFGIKVRNNGSETYAIDNITAQVMTPEGPQLDPDDLNGTVTCRDFADGKTDGKEMLQPISIGGSQPEVTMRCTAVLNPGAETGQELRKLGVSQRLLINLMGVDGSHHSKDFCFTANGENVFQRADTDLDCD